MSRPVPKPRFAILLPALALAGCAGLPDTRPVDRYIHVEAPVAASGATYPFVLDNGRIFIALTFRKPDGGARKALTWVNMGLDHLFVSPALRAELGAGPVRLDLGETTVVLDPPAVQPLMTPEVAAQEFSNQPVEAMLPPSVMARFRVTFDYAAHTLTFAPASAAPAPGVAVPMHVNPGTGLASVAASVDGHAYRAVLDCGGGYSWWRGEVVRGWLKVHPDWFRAQGAVGASNQGMSGEALEHQGTVVRAPHLLLGDLDVPQAGLLGSGPAQGGGLDNAKYVLFWHVWGGAAPEAPVGWIGANILKRYRLTLDYPHRVSYWQEVAPPETDELHGVGLSLSRGIKNVHVAGLVSRPGAPSLSGVRLDDFLTAIDGRDARTMTHGELLQALHGEPGETHRLTLDRKGVKVEVTARVEDF